MSSSATGSSRSYRIGRATGLGRWQASTVLIHSKAQMRRVFEIVMGASVLMLIMFGGLALRAALSLIAGVH